MQSTHLNTMKPRTTTSRTASLALSAFLCASAAHAQTVIVARQPDQAGATLPGIMNLKTIVLDASHGGADGGARLGDSLLEKSVTLALALKLQTLLAARGFNVVMTRTTDNAEKPVPDKPTSPATPLSLDDRAGSANRARASACLLLHAAASGRGVHLYSSELDGVPTEAAVLPWLTAQSAWVVESVHLQRQLAESLRRSGVPRISGRASARPIDSLTCPAVVVELAPETAEIASIAGDDYQQRVAQAIAAALELWPTQTHPPARSAPAPPKPAPTPALNGETGAQP